jgi:hypothetical protein
MVRDGLKMGRIHADLVSAQVVDIKPRIKLSSQHPIRHTMRQLTAAIAALVPVPPVSSPKLATGPLPAATRRDSDGLPEADREPWVAKNKPMLAIVHATIHNTSWDLAHAGVF